MSYRRICDTCGARAWDMVGPPPGWVHNYKDGTDACADCVRKKQEKDMAETVDNIRRRVLEPDAPIERMT